MKVILTPAEQAILKMTESHRGYEIADPAGVISGGGRFTLREAQKALATLVAGHYIQERNRWYWLTDAGHVLLKVGTIQQQAGATVRAKSASDQGK